MVAILRDPMSLFYTQKEEKEEGSGSPQSEMVVEGNFLETEGFLGQIHSSLGLHELTYPKELTVPQ